MAAVEALLDRPEARPAALVLDGEAGIGKTTVWLAAVQRAQQKRRTMTTTASATLRPRRRQRRRPRRERQLPVRAEPGPVGHRLRRRRRRLRRAVRLRSSSDRQREVRAAGARRLRGYAARAAAAGGVSHTDSLNLRGHLASIDRLDGVACSGNRATVIGRGQTPFGIFSFVRTAPRSFSLAQPFRSSTPLPVRQPASSASLTRRSASSLCSRRTAV